ncbi:conserved protein of unknown function [Rhodovastum atsumiense]|uniref:Uncharacterized protein n=1 Tax=Rhodovastum atsumiense TaxID=504468 RepID=A0A5M6IS68_9PROT|nr:hypothetical protein [Rhodovastum atsumiense]KAA5610325.1 hypothetical protein F1189_19630 [Rhodovastum atsumiense]CAH2600937.1 conserved protein of unknown function [Rhodovastum atsumiense]
MRIALLVLVVLAGCSAPRVVLRNPATGNVAECQADSSLSWDPKKAVEICAQSYEAGGYRRIGSF